MVIWIYVLLLNYYTVTHTAKQYIWVQKWCGICVYIQVFSKKLGIKSVMHDEDTEDLSVEERTNN